MVEMQDNMISVIIPVYNAERYIKYTLDSVVSQDYPEKEIVIVDDCSSDQSPIIIKEYMKDYPYIVYHQLNKNSGVAIARNTGIKLAKGRYIAFVDSDDVWMPNKLSKQIMMFKDENTPPQPNVYRN